MNYGELKNKMRDEAIAEQESKFYEMAKKPSESPFGEVSTAPSQTVTGAVQAPQEQGIFAGSGGYEYGKLADGSFMILKSGKGFNPGTVVKPGMKGYDAIKQEFETVMSGGRPTEKPRAAAPKSAPKAAPKAEAPKAEAPKVRGRPNSPSMQSMRDEPRGGESMQEPGDPRMGESLRDVPRISPYGPTDYDRAKARMAAREPTDRFTAQLREQNSAQYREAAAANKYSSPRFAEDRMKLIGQAAQGFVSVHRMPEKEAYATAQSMADAGSYTALEALAARAPMSTK